MTEDERAAAPARVEPGTAEPAGAVQALAIPATAEPVPAEPTPVEAVPAEVLLVEDEDALRNLLERFLQRAGYAVRAERDGSGALAAFAEGPERFQAAIIDLTLPDMSGEALLAGLRERRPRLAVVVSSGMSRTEAEFASPEGGPVRFLQKPFLPARLIEALKELPAAQSSSPASAS